MNVQYMGITALLLAAESTDLTLPLGVWSAIGGIAITALGLLYRNQRSESGERHAEVVALTRDVTAALVQNSASLRELTACVQSLAQMVQGLKNG